MAGNFNIWNSNWNLSYPFHLIHSDFLFNIIDSFDLMLSSPINQVFTHYSDNMDDENSVIDLMFLKPNFSETDNVVATTRPVSNSSASGKSYRRDI